MANGYERAIVILADVQKEQIVLHKTQTELLAKMSANIEGMRVEVKDNTEEVSKLRKGWMRIFMILVIALSAVVIPTNGLELIRLAFGGGI